VAGGDNCVETIALESKALSRRRGAGVAPPPPALPFNDEVMNEKRYASTPHLFLEDMLCEWTSLSSLFGFLQIPNIHVFYY
jgi:hypothetical protein